MPDIATILPSRRPELVVRPLGDRGEHVVKDPRTGAYYHLGEQEAFLLEQLDGSQSWEGTRAAFAERFGQTLSDEDLDEFLQMTRGQGLLQQDDASAASPAAAPAAAPSFLPIPPALQRFLYWRKNLFDPDRLFTWLEPRLRFFWSGTFLVVSVASI